MGLFAIRYTYKSGSEALRDEHRPKHVDFLNGLHKNGVLLTSGPTDASGTYPGALLVIQAADAQAADEIMAQDPYTRYDVLEREVWEWHPVFGQHLWQEAGAS